MRRPGLRRLRAFELVTRPVHPETAAALARRWRELPDAVRTPAQLLGRHGVGCEGIHGVFPRCNLVCTPCYHSRDANRVRVDAAHTVREVTAQMALAARVRGPRAHAQLIGGEVSLLEPDDHAAALQAMIDAGRQPMSFTHGDVDDDYLTRLALGPDGRKRFSRLSFAVHVDSLMFGRRGIERPSDEASLQPTRRRFVDLCRRLRTEHGVRYFVAHNMTVTPTNLPQVAQVVRDSRDLGYGLFSFQPAAFVGDDRRWHEEYGDPTGDDVWAQVEAGAGRRLPFRALQLGDERCNRTTFGYYVGPDYFPLLDDRSPADLRTRDAFLRHFGGVSFSGTPPQLLVVKVARVVARHPLVVAPFAAWVGRQVRAVGVRRLLHHRRIRPTTFTMHSFMDAADVIPAWELMERGETAAEPRLVATQERLRACSYSMAHPETGRLVPACVQHSVLDPGENVVLRKLLPLNVMRPAGPTSRPAPARV